MTSAMTSVIGCAYRCACEIIGDIGIKSQVETLHVYDVMHENYKLPLNTCVAAETLLFKVKI